MVFPAFFHRSVSVKRIDWRKLTQNEAQMNNPRPLVRDRGRGWCCNVVGGTLAYESRPLLDIGVSSSFPRTAIMVVKASSSAFFSRASDTLSRAFSSRISRLSLRCIHCANHFNRLMLRTSLKECTPLLAKSFRGMA